MPTILADSFQSSLARLTGSEQRQVKVAAFDIQTEPDRPGHRPDDAQRRQQHPARKQPYLPRSRRRSADPQLGRHARRRAHLPAERLVGQRLPGPCDPLDRSRPQSSRRLAA